MATEQGARGKSSKQDTDAALSQRGTNDVAGKRKKNGLARFITRLFIGGGLLGLLCLGGLYLYYQDSINKPRDFSNQIVRINSGDSFSVFAKKLTKMKVIDEPYSFRLLAKRTGLAGKLHTGRYQLADGLNLQQILDKVTTGQDQLTHTVRFVQGSNFKQMLASLKEAPHLEQTLDENVTGRQLMKSLFDRDIHPEGLFYPDTYLYHQGDSDVSILQRAYKLMDEKLDAIWASRAKGQPYKTPYEALIMASIIEKETAMASERPLISGVFRNRLNIDMRLQTDPTVIYGIGDAYDGNITRKHLKTDTPYNTYTRKGLPPTPICLPGEAAIKAAVNPEKTKALYFVAVGDGTGAHYFSKSLQEHNKAVKRYLANRKKNKS